MVNELKALTAQQPQPPAAGMGQQFLGLVGKAFTEEQQQWISAHIMELPKFIESDAGKATLQLMLSEFKKTVG